MVVLGSCTTMRGKNDNCYHFFLSYTEAQIFFLSFYFFLFFFCFSSCSSLYFMPFSSLIFFSSLSFPSFPFLLYILLCFFSCLFSIFFLCFFFFHFFLYLSSSIFFLSSNPLFPSIYKLSNRESITPVQS
jgi:hypothetical protein